MATLVPGGDRELGGPGEAVEEIVCARAEVLRRLPLREGFSTEFLRHVAEAMEQVPYAPGDPIIRRGEQGRRFSVMLSGRAEVRIPAQNGTTATVATMKPGDSFGESRCRARSPRRRT